MLGPRLALPLLLAALAVPVTHGLIADAPAPAVPLQSMQADASHPLWGALRATGRTPAEWAALMLADADGNGRTDFLDVVALTAAAAGLSATPVELLVYADDAATPSLIAAWPGAVAIPDAHAVFLTAPLGRLSELRVPGVSLVVWEPRAEATVNTQNPSGGTPASLSQNALAAAGTAWGGSPSYTGSGVTIAILDTGVDTGHQALDGGKVTKWKDCVSNTSPAYDDHGHGTHVASIAAGDDGTDFKGIAYNANIAGVKILNAGGSGTIAQFQCGVNWVKSGGVGGTPQADVASMSAGLTVPPLGITTLNGGQLDLFGWDVLAWSMTAGGIPFSIAAGNWLYVRELIGYDETTRVGVNGVNQVSSPGFSSYALTVGAVDGLGAAAQFSALGPGATASYKPDVVAQGVDTYGALKGTTSWYADWDGTSMATPVVGGVLALLHEKNASTTVAAYYNAVRNGAGPACAAYSGSCLVPELPDPNFVTGHGVAKAPGSLALV